MARAWKSKRQIALSGTSLAVLMLFAAGTALAQTSDGPADQASSDTAEIVVTGSIIRGVPPIGSNLISIGRSDIETIGAANTPDLSASIPQLDSFNTAPQTSAGTGPGLGSFAPALRGLPANATLPLMDGHRLIGAGVQVTNPDYPLIPNLALERIEVVADGASATYGSDAVAGVVNFITRKNVSGVEVSADYGVADDYYSGNIGGVFGRDWGSGSILAAYQYTENNDITGGDRDYRVLDYTPWGGVDARPVACPTPTVASTPFYASQPPAGYYYLGGYLTYYAYDPATGTVGAANSTNHCDSGAAADLLPSSRIHAGFLSGHQDLGDRATLWGEILYSDRHDDIQVAAPAESVDLYPFNPNYRGPLGSTFEVVNFRVDDLIGSDHFTNTNHKMVGNSSLGIDFKLPRDLKLSVYGTLDWAENDSFVPGIDATALNYYASNNDFTAGAPLFTASTDPATALDPFGASTSPATVAAILNYASDVTELQHVNLAAMKLDGPLFDLPGGQLKIALGAEYRHESFEQRGYVGTAASPVPENLGRDVESVYGELFVPIVGASNEAPLFHSLVLSLSGRYDNYSDFGSTTNPKIGVNWEPVEGLTLRGSYGTSFRAPGLRELGATVGAYYYSSLISQFYIYPSLVNQSVLLLGGNPHLQPEQATTYSFGADLHPASLPGFRGSLTYYNIDYTSVIGSPAVASVFTDPTLASLLITGDPSVPGPLNTLLYGIGAVPIGWPSASLGTTTTSVVDLRDANLGSRKTDGLDADISYRWTTNFGAVFADFAGNYILSFDTQLSPGAPVSDSLKLGEPRWTARATLGADIGPVSLASFVNYRDGITNTFATPTGASSYDSDPYVTVDLRAAWTLPKVGWTEGTVLALQVDNLFDQDPPFFPASTASPTFDGIGGSYNPIGRFIALNLRKKF